MDQAIRVYGEQALVASRELTKLSLEKKNAILLSMAEELDSSREYILAKNAIDVSSGKKAGLSSSLLDRLLLNEQRIDGMIAAIREIAMLLDPVGQIISELKRPNGLLVRKIRVPIGVVAIIYESRPNVTSDSASLCLKSSNAVILRGGSEAINSNLAICETLVRGGAKSGLPKNAIQLITTTERGAIKDLVQLEGLIDVVIPRGGEGLIRAVTEMARVPVLKHYKGVCHTYVDSSADLKKALDICENAKCQRPGVCNAMETLLVHQDIANAFLPEIHKRLLLHGVELRGDLNSCKILSDINLATEDDWSAEYLDLILAVKVVSGVDEAISHINNYGSRHSDAIVAEDQSAQNKFLLEVDASAVFVNSSTRFNDGGQFGLGAELGISTDKLHARGPMGLEELTTYKFQVIGSGQVRE